MIPTPQASRGSVETDWAEEEAVAEITQLRAALTSWRNGEREYLFEALGYRPVGLSVPREGLAEFGLDPGDGVALEVAAATDGFHVLLVTLPGPLNGETIRSTAAALYRHNPARRALLMFTAREDPRLVFASWGLGPGPFRLLKLWIDPGAPRRSELDVLAGLAADGVPTASELAHGHARALDREQVTRRFFREFRHCRAVLAAALTGVPKAALQDRLDLALILLTRLLFIYFVQRKGWLAGDPSYLRRAYERSLQEGRPYYRSRLEPLFFGALNRRARQRGKAARALGELPYLNGGLFERHGLEKKHPRLDIPDELFASLFDELLEKYQFTLREDQPADQDVAVDPEMLGRVFEGLMAAPTRGSTGTFYTPRSLVDRLVDAALVTHVAGAGGCQPEILEQLLRGDRPGIDPRTRRRLAARVRAVRVLDPAVGSGAFLLTALQRLETLRDALEGRPRDPFARFERRQEIIRGSLHGVDINGAAVRLCELRLWLALVVDLEVGSIAEIPPLPNLDLNIRQGDALLDPIDFLVGLADLDFRSLAGRWSRTQRELGDRKARYFHCSGGWKTRLERSLRRAERDLAVGCVAELLEQIRARRRELRAAAGSRTLFGDRAGLSRRQRREAARLKRRAQEASRLLKKIREDEELPFFSFPIHFARPDDPGTGFQVVVGNPPWIRTHRWTGPSRARLRQRYQVLRDAGWPYGSRLAGAGRGFAGQLDLSALFLERALDLLDEGGTVGFLLPAKLARGLAWSGVRKRVLRSARIIELEDCSLAADRFFDATTYPLRLVLAAGEANAGHEVRISVHQRDGDTLRFRTSQSRLPLLGDDGAPWVLAPPAVREALEGMRGAGAPVGSRPGRRPSRGIVTGRNAVFVGADAEVGPGGRARVRLDGIPTEIETECLRPTLRGEDLSPWDFRTTHALVWTHSADGAPRPSLPPATGSYLSQHESALRRRRDLKPGRPWWSLFRVRPEKWDLRVAWRDIADEPGAAVVPPSVPFLADRAPLVSLNTVYQIAIDSESDAHLLAAVLNSTPARAYLKAIAERASGGYFRFLGWTVALLPFPERPDPALADRCADLSRKAHRARGLDAARRIELDGLVARLYGLGPEQLQLLQEFDARLSNARPAT